jgi:hypothetical protein
MDFGGEMSANYSASGVFMGAFGIGETGTTIRFWPQPSAAMMERARELVVPARSTKFDWRGSLLLCGFEKIPTIVSDDGISEAHREMVASTGGAPDRCRSFSTTTEDGPFPLPLPLKRESNPNEQTKKTTAPAAPTGCTSPGMCNADAASAPTP